MALKRSPLIVALRGRVGPYTFKTDRQHRIRSYRIRSTFGKHTTDPIIIYMREAWKVIDQRWLQLTKQQKLTWELGKHRSQTVVQSALDHYRKTNLRRMSIGWPGLEEAPDRQNSLKIYPSLIHGSGNVRWDTEGYWAAGNSKLDNPYDPEDGPIDIPPGHPDDYKPWYSIGAADYGQGTIFPDGWTDYIPEGANKKYSMTPAPGWFLDELWVDYVSVDPVDTWWFNNIREDHYIEAIFSLTGVECPPLCHTCPQYLYVTIQGLVCPHFELQLDALRIRRYVPLGYCFWSGECPQPGEPRMEVLFWCAGEQWHVYLSSSHGTYDLFWQWNPELCPPAGNYVRTETSECLYGECWIQLGPPP